MAQNQDQTNANLDQSKVNQLLQESYQFLHIKNTCWYYFKIFCYF